MYCINIITYDLQDNLKEKSNCIIYLLIVLLLICGVAYSLMINDTIIFPDEREYLSIANNLLTTGIYSIDGELPTAKRPPGYPLILYILMQCGASLPIYRIFNFLLLAYILFITNKLLVNKENKIAGLLAALLISLYPIYFFIAGTILSQTSGLALFVTVIYLISREQSSLLSFFTGGILYGCLVLTVPLFLLNLPIVSLAPLLLRSREWPKEIAVFLLSSFLIMGVWTTRNYFIFDHFVPLTTNSGLNFLLGNHEKSHPTSYIDVYNYINSDKFLYKMRGLNEVEKDIFYRNEAWKWVNKNKNAALKLYLLKVINYFNYKDTIATENKAFIFRDILMFIFYIPLLMVFIIRFIMISHYNINRFEMYLMLVYLSNAFFMAIFHIRIRWRSQYDILLICIVAIFLAKVMIKNCFVLRPPRVRHGAPGDEPLGI